jgi:hypothetical protein
MPTDSRLILGCARTPDFFDIAFVSGKFFMIHRQSAEAGHVVLNRHSEWPDGAQK